MSFSGSTYTRYSTNEQRDRPRAASPPPRCAQQPGAAAAAATTAVASEPQAHPLADAQLQVQILDLTASLQPQAAQEGRDEATSL